VVRKEQAAGVVALLHGQPRDRRLARAAWQARRATVDVGAGGRFEVIAAFDLEDDLRVARERPRPESIQGLCRRPAFAEKKGHHGRAFAPSPFQGEGWGEGAMPANQRLGSFVSHEAESLSTMPALHAKTPSLVVTNARHSPSYGCAFRLDRGRCDAPLKHVRKTLSL